MDTAARGTANRRADPFWRVEFSQLTRAGTKQVGRETRDCEPAPAIVAGVLALEEA